MLIQKYKKLLQHQSGFTLVELIVGITLLLIILSAIYSSLTVGIKSYQYNLSQAQNIASAQELLNELNTELKYVTAISLSPNTSIFIPNSQLDYGVVVDTKTEKRSISTRPGTSSTTNTLVISHNGVIYKTVAINNLLLINIARDLTYPNKLTISATLDNKQYTNSPTMELSTTIIMSNI